MTKFIIEGGKPLKGEISVSGAKNAALPIIAATLLTNKECIITNVPKISDVEVMLEILKRLGAEVDFRDNAVKICTKNVKSWKPDIKLVGRMRASIVLVGPLLARFGKAKVHYPGGCLIGARPIDIHIEALKDLGAKIKVHNKGYDISLDPPKNKEIILKDISVTGTENILTVCALSSSRNKINIAAIEPEVQDLCDFLEKIGVKFEGRGTHNLTIIGKNNLVGARHKIIPDRIEAATFMILSIATKSSFKIKNVNLDHLDAFLAKLREMGVLWKMENNVLTLKTPLKLNPVSIKTGIYPCFATDFQAPFAVLMTQADGTGLIFETIFENRLNYIKELTKMGADIKLKDLHRAEFFGPTKLSGTKIESFDLRAGATLIVAALCAEGESEISNGEIIDRGYEKIDQRLQKLGAQIKRINNSPSEI